MAEEFVYEQKIPIDSRDVDGQGQCRPSALLGHMQETATQAAERHGFGRILMEEPYQAYWVLTRIWYRLDRPLYWGEELAIRTWHRGGKAATTYRDFDLLVEGEPVGEAVSLWVLMQRETGRIIKLSTVAGMARTDGGSRCKTITLSRLQMPDGLEPEEPRLLRYSDTDINGHVNNTRYADFACDALHMERRADGVFVSQMQIGFLGQCYPGERLELLTGRRDEARFVRGQDAQGKVRFDAMLVFGGGQGA